MADPLSIASGIAGLLALAGSLTKVLNTVVSDTQNAPDLAHFFLCEITAMEAALQGVERLVSGDGQYLDEEQLSLIPASALRAVLTGCLITASRNFGGNSIWIAVAQIFLARNCPTNRIRRGYESARDYVQVAHRSRCIRI